MGIADLLTTKAITLFYSSKTKSEIYLAALPLLGMGKGSEYGMNPATSSRN